MQPEAVNKYKGCGFFLDIPEAGFTALLSFIFILINGFFVIMETAITESHKSRIDKLAEEKSTLAAAATATVDEPDKLLAVTRFGITLMSILIGILTGTVTAPLIATLLEMLPGFAIYAQFTAFALSILLITYLNLLLGEFLPKKISLNDPEIYLLRYLPTLLWLEKITRPFAFLMEQSATTLFMLLGINPHVDDSVTEDEVKDLIEQGTEDGTFEKAEQDMVDRIFHMSDQTAYSLMTPRTQLFWLDLEDSAAHNLQLIRENPDTVFPVGRDNLDDFAGVLYAKDLLNAAIDGKTNDLTAYIRKPMFIPRSMETFRVLEKFRESGIHEAIVLDEYGGVIGFITLRDIVNEIIGDIADSSDAELIQITPRDENSWLVDGLYDIDDFKDKFGLDELPDEDRAHYQTMGGFITAYLGYIPKVAEKFQWNDFCFEIVDMDRARIDKILLTRIEPAATTAEDDKPA